MKDKHLVKFLEKSRKLCRKIQKIPISSGIFCKSKFLPHHIGKEKHYKIACHLSRRKCRYAAP